MRGMRPPGASRGVAPDAAGVSAVRRAASRKGLEARWGAGRGPSRQIRVDAAAADALLAIPERDRRGVASGAIVDAAAAYLRGLARPRRQPRDSTAGDARRTTSSSSAS